MRYRNWWFSRSMWVFLKKLVGFVMGNISVLFCQLLGFFSEKCSHVFFFFYYFDCPLNTVSPLINKISSTVRISQTKCCDIELSTVHWELLDFEMKNKKVRVLFFMFFWLFIYCICLSIKTINSTYCTLTYFVIN